MGASNTAASNLPFIGVAGIILKDGKVLLGKRNGNHGQGSWAPPGGKLEFGERFDEAVKREVLEETGLKVAVTEFITVTNNVFKEENKHSITLFFLCKSGSADAKIMEPEKCEEWAWFAWDKLPKPLFIPVEELLKQGFDPSKPFHAGIIK